MRHVWVIVFVLGGCGGVVQVDRDAGTPCPSSNPQDMACSVEYAKCTLPSTLCDASTSAPCTCVGGQWNCPEYSACPSPTTCPSHVAEGTPCSDAHLACQMSDFPTCIDFPPTCTCNGTTFLCPGVTCPALDAGKP